MAEDTTTPKGAYATVADLRAATGDDTISDNDQRALTLLKWASAKVDEFCGRSFPLEGSDTVPTIVQQIVATVAGRAWVNPSGAQEVNEAAGPFSFASSFGSGQAVASVPLALRASEKDDLARYKVRRSGIGTLATYREVPVAPATYVNPVDGGKPFPWPNPDAL